MYHSGFDVDALKGASEPLDVEESLQKPQCRHRNKG